MKITLISTENIYYFRGLIANYYYKKDANDLCVGLIDDENSAVAACVFNFEHGAATLKFVATDYEKRRKGYASYLINSVCEMLKELKASEITAYGYVDDENKYHLVNKNTRHKEKETSYNPEVLMKLLEKCGFTQRTLPVTRCVYKLGDFSKLDEYTVEGHRGILKGREELKLTNIDSLYRGAIKYDGDVAYLNFDTLLAEDKYSTYFTCRGNVLAFAHVEELSDALCVDSIYAEGSEGFAVLPGVFRAVKDKASEAYGEDMNVYIDCYGEKLKKYMIKIVGKLPEKEITGVRFERRV